MHVKTTTREDGTVIRHVERSPDWIEMTVWPDSSGAEFHWHWRVQNALDTKHDEGGRTDYDAAVKDAREAARLMCIDAAKDVPDLWATAV